MIEITQQSQDLPVSLSEQEVRQKVRAEWGSYSREFSGFPHTRLIFFNNMSLKFPHRLENPNDFMAMGLAVSGDKVPIPDENVGLHSPLYFSHPYRRFCATLAQTVNRLGLDENVKQAEVKKKRVGCQES